MGVHFGVGFGRFTHLFIGDTVRSEYLLVGKAVAEASSMLEKTNRGQIAVMVNAWEAFRKRIAYVADEAQENMSVIITKDSDDFKYIALRRFYERNAPHGSEIDVPSLNLNRKVVDFLDEYAVNRVSRLATENDQLDIIHYRLSELRRISSVFLQVKDFPSTSESGKALDFVQSLYLTIMKPLRVYKGRLRQIVFDDKGLTALMVWGLPPANASDHILALFCAIAIRDAMKTASLGKFSIGVSSGPTFTGLIGNAVRSDFNLFGRSINLAARCMSLPDYDNEILCDLSSIEQNEILTGGFEFSEQRPVHVKGVTEALPVAILHKGTKDPLRIGFSLRLKEGRSQSIISIQPSLSFQDRFSKAEMARSMGSGKIVGRMEELALIEKSIDEWALNYSIKGIGNTKGVIIFGKSGCGKTTFGRFCEQQVMNMSITSGVIVGKADCFEIARYSPFYVTKLLLIQIFNQLLAFKELIIEQKQLLEAYLEEQYLQTITSKKSSKPLTATSRQTSELSGATSQHKSVKTLQNEQSVRSLASQHTENSGASFGDSIRLNDCGENVTELLRVLEILGFSKKFVGATVMEELFSRSLSDIVSLLNSNIDGFVVIQSRPMKEISEEALITDIIYITKMTNCLQVNLDVMDISKTSDMVKLILGKRAHPSLVEEIHRNSGGIPMVIEILTIGLKAPGVLRESDGYVKLRDGYELKADERDAGSLISSQFDQLPSRFQSLLKVASVLGIGFPLDLVVQVFNDLHATAMQADVTEKLTPDDALQLIQNEDKFDFISSNYENDNTRSFRHIYIQRGIQSLIITDLRKRTHFQFFLYLDNTVRGAQSILGPTAKSIKNVASGVPLLESNFHLQASGDQLENHVGSQEAKRVRLDYLRLMADFYFEKQIHGEALITLRKLLEIWDELKRNGNGDDYKIVPDDLTRAGYYGMLAHVLRTLSLIEELREPVVRGLELAGLKFPSTPGKLMSQNISTGMKAIKYHCEMRRFLKTVKRENKGFDVIVDYNAVDTRYDLIGDLLGKLVFCALIDEKNPLTLAATIQSIAHPKNVFQSTCNHPRASSFLSGDEFRDIFGGAHTSLSIALLTCHYTEDYLNSQHVPSEITDYLQQVDIFLDKRVGELQLGGREKPIQGLCDYGGNELPVIFTVIGRAPPLYSLETCYLFADVAFDVRTRDIFDMQAKYFLILIFILQVS
ncbi:Adenylate cyclase type 10 [Dinochytrium kinnereticum]|nr:Adenylate cyclase type 10 [Dinochytrium kinnereticum]